MAKLIEKRGAIDILPEDLPFLVTFADVQNPQSVQAVDPNNLAEILGPGFAWRSMTLEITDEPLTTGIDERLTWLRTLGGYLDGQRIRNSNNLANTLDVGHFKSN